MLNDVIPMSSLVAVGLMTSHVCWYLWCQPVLLSVADFLLFDFYKHILEFFIILYLNGYV